jgi:ketosteroid isomerase-like protein
MDMPDVVKDYFDADRCNDANALSNTFSLDAIVEDEGARRQGVIEIRKWWLAAKKGADYTAEPLETTIDGNLVSVRAEVSGEFPGSPVTLAYAFTINDDKIVRLEMI